MLTTAFQLRRPIRTMQIRTAAPTKKSNRSRSHFVCAKNQADELEFNARSRKRMRNKIATTETKPNERTNEKNAATVHPSRSPEMNAF